MVLLHVGKLFGSKARYISTSFYDGVIVGGGMVGNAMACSLGAAKPLVKSPLFSNRTSAVTPASIKFFKMEEKFCDAITKPFNLEIGVWEKFLDYRAKRVDRYEVIDSSSHSTLNFSYPDAVKEVSYIIENNVIVSHLLTHVMEKCRNVTVKTNANVVQCKSVDTNCFVIIPDSLLEDVLLVMDDGTEIETSLVIGADGGNSVVRKAFSPSYTSWKYNQKGVVAVVELDCDGPNNVAWQRFSRHGPIALLPLSSRHSNLIWTTSDSHAKELLSSTPNEFVDLLNHALHTEEYQDATTNKTLELMDRALNVMFNIENTRIPSPPQIVRIQPDSRAAFPLVFGHSHTYVSARAALIGDAAHRIHPLGGLGANLGWSDVRKLTASMEKCVMDGGDLGATTYLSQYDTDSQRHNVPQQIACDWINRLYRTNNPAAIFFRSIGLSSTNHMQCIKVTYSPIPSASPPCTCHFFRTP
uniref:FAD_binding_3 domain-containing protein n=1 Tax=Syphacia muris TaxID=451379 RepID=A0A0N5AU94_9BILA